ncbi:hypothetical protein [Pseudorhodoferax sp. Leaf274]|uniref:hypothetical protein n=1 Tax=Pseudorhodoferax sp. Leaf274 TaxID=1736318 RepID=UPI000703AB0F|nr:hypothetical protein [Pseudorhodoferax sp. Leaf274]KQP45020.1 hypothetical protein ASF44_26405 [Pseudorhodoferax sp. Leaf274]
MTNLLVLDDTIFQNALRAARAMGNDTPLPVGVLNSPLGDDASYWVNRLWDAAETALTRAYRDGRAAAQPLIDKLAVQLQEAGTAVAGRFADISASLTEKLNAYLQAAIDGALARVRPFITIGGERLALQKVGVEQKISLSGSLKASLESLCEFVADGEFAISTEYASHAAGPR